jgi:hypothetical protein
METKNKGSSPLTAGCLTIVISFIVLLILFTTLEKCSPAMSKKAAAGGMLVHLFTAIVLLSILYALFADPDK